MENRISKLKVDFNNLINIRNNVKVVFDILQTRINKLKQFYSDFIKNNKNKLFVFGLDSFHFQSKLIDIEYDDMRRLFLAINNRMYCEYFKLYKIIIEYVYENINDKKITEIIKLNNFPIYKDLEPYKEYNIELITEIHENILIVINSILSNLIMRENELDNHKSKKDFGLNIDNFITSFNYELIVMREKISMFLTYIEFFHELHIKHLKRFNNKIQLLYTHISTDIKVDETVEVDKEDKKYINEIENITVNNILYNKDIEPNNNILINELLETTSKDSKDSNHSIKEKIKNNMNRLTSFIKMRSNKDIMNYKDISVNNNVIIENFKSISEECDSILNNIRDNNNIVISKSNENVEDISDVSTNDTLITNNEIKEDVEENIQITYKVEEKVEENVEIIEENIQLIKKVEIIEEEEENVEIIQEVKEEVIHDEPKKKRTYKPRKKKEN